MKTANIESVTFEIPWKYGKWSQLTRNFYSGAEKKECIIETREGEKQNKLRETKANVVSRLRGCDNRLLCDTNFIIIFFLNPLHPNLKIHILHTRLYTLSLVRTRRILLAIKAS